MARLLLLGLAAAATCCWAATPEQVFITLGTAPGAMTVSWVTMGREAASEDVTYGPISGAHSQASTGTSEVLDKGKPMRIHVANMTGLQPNQTIYYSVGGDEATEFSFVNEPFRDGGKVWALFADLGLADDFALSTLLEDSAAGVFDAVLTAGDYAYNMEDKEGAVGNEFMNGLQPIISTRPWLTAPGNHDTDADDSFRNYLARFAAVREGPGRGSGSRNSRWYSFEDGAMHVVVIDTEVFQYGTNAQIEEQHAWLAADLAAVNRTATPWLLAAGHKAPWEPKTDWTQYLDALFKKHAVDILLCGHSHNYQRTYPVVDEALADPDCVAPGADGNDVYKDCQGTVMLTVGSPGMDQGMGSRLAPSDVLRAHEFKWGYGYLTAVSRNELRWHWFETVTADPTTGRSVRVPRGAGAQDYATFLKSS